MEGDRSFNFKLFVPPRMSTAQVSAVRPQEVVGNSGDVMDSLQQGYSMCFDKGQNMPFNSKPTRRDFPKMKAVPPMEKDEDNCNPGQLYSKLFDEVGKIKCWKVKADSDMVQKDRRLQDNKRTIETQRKAIQELQFGNESLSIKLEEQISENEDLRNKNNATSNLCNILKDAVQGAAEKMQLFETEREETHHLFRENSERVQKVTAVFESLRIQVESDQQEMQKVKEGFLEFEELKEKCYQEYKTKEEQVTELETKLQHKENDLQKIRLDLHESQKHCKQLQEATDKQDELLKRSETEQDFLVQKLHTAEQHCKDTQQHREAVAAALEQSKEEFAQVIQSKDLSLQELSRIKNQQAEKLGQVQTTMKELQNSLALEIQRARELEDKLRENKKELERTSTLLRETLEQSAEKDGQIKILEDDLDMKSKSIESMKGEIDVTDVKVEELSAKLSRKIEEVKLYKNEAEVAFAETDLLKAACVAAKMAQEDLKEKSTMAEIKVQVLEGQLSSEMKKNEEHTFQMSQLRKDVILHEEKYEELLSSFRELQSEKLALQQQFESGSSNAKAIEANMKVIEEKNAKVTQEIQRLEEENLCLMEEVNFLKTHIQEKCEETQTLQKEIEENYERLQVKLTERETRIKTVETKLSNLRKKIETKLKAQEEYQKENKILKKQIAKEIAKSSHLENVINNLHKESQSFKRLIEEDHQKLLKDLEYKSAFAVERENEAVKLRLKAAEAVKDKEDAELKCQHKVADMVALMEKHKSQYDRMAEEKDAELDENKKKMLEAVAHRKSLELDLSKCKTENNQLKKQLNTETTEKRELNDLKKEMTSVKITQLSDARNKQSPASNFQQGNCSETLTESTSWRHVFDFSKTRKTPSYSKEDGSTAVMKNTGIHNEGVKTPTSLTYGVGKPSKIKSYRIKTPPSSENEVCWGKGTTVFDLRSDSSDHNDLLTFANTPAPSSSAPPCKLSTVEQIHSPVAHRSPRNFLKLVAMKRMRDAGWTAVTGLNKKKKKNSEKIFA